MIEFLDGVAAIILVGFILLALLVSVALLTVACFQYPFLIIASLLLFAFGWASYRGGL